MKHSFDMYQRKAMKALAEITPSNQTWSDPRLQGSGLQGIALSSERFPVPDLVRFGLCVLKELVEWGPDEKLRWGVTGRYCESTFVVTLEKFGMRLYVPDNHPHQDTSRLIGRLITASILAEACLKEFAQRQVELGNVTVENQFHYFDHAYKFFRQKAQVAYDSPPPESTKHRNSAGEVTGGSWEPMKYQIEGGYLAGAMVDAYFSRLEHLLVLVLPFLDFDPAEGNLVAFVGLSWDEKWRRVFDVSSDGISKPIYDSLHIIKETIRNPLAHGGFLKKGTSFYFHVPSIGALPALMSKHGRTFELSITRVPKSTYSELCAALDKCDEFLLASPVAPGVRFGQAGLDVAFSTEFRAKCKAAATSDETLTAFMDHQYYMWERHANMDY